MVSDEPDAPHRCQVVEVELDDCDHKILHGCLAGHLLTFCGRKVWNRTLIPLNIWGQAGEYRWCERCLWCMKRYRQQFPLLDRRKQRGRPRKARHVNGRTKFAGNGG